MYFMLCYIIYYTECLNVVYELQVHVTHIGTNLVEAEYVHVLYIFIYLYEPLAMLGCTPKTKANGRWEDEGRVFGV